ncbi:transcriptional regulator GlxA family with amidase domain [Antricoccus suffuscus]|uniref:Transcriptional regulator GlxA family with amidase domain n=1 Tax=Antricoccus suffuscus TaxID=1629062 RepID=A0A2T1A510_9ACTN|nr:transcriptional regulator GlxA family with amidase domain [Antricoccus suffuscus]
MVVLCFNDVQSLDITGPLEVFASANKIRRPDADDEPYECALVSAAGTVRTSSGLTLLTDKLPLNTAGIDTIVVPGGFGARHLASDDPTVRWLTRAAPRARRVATVCTGAFIAGRAGLLVGREVTTHWAYGEQLQNEFPEAAVNTDPIYRHDEDLWSSAGVTAGIDLALALVQTDLGHEASQTIARWLVMFLHRPGSQSQFAMPSWAPRARLSPIREAQNLVAADPAADHRVGVLATKVGMSERNFTRVFLREVGVSPARYVEDARVRTARVLLEKRDGTTNSIAHRCGFGTAETMRRAFIRHVGIAPDHYRGRFGNV